MTELRTRLFVFAVLAAIGVIGCVVTERDAPMIANANREQDAGAGRGDDGGVPRNSGDNPSDAGARCGDGIVSGVERCDIGIPADQPGACPSECPPLARCVARVLNGSACQAECVLVELVCQGGDGCCPGKCTQDNDPDCSPTCGDGIVQASRGETCERDSTSPCKESDAECDDGELCTVDKLIGSAANCNADCSHIRITALTPGDKCCPTNANANIDPDCMPVCGNGVSERGEECDGSDGCDADCKRIGTTDQLRCLAAAKTDCEKCACMNCTATELACRMSPDTNSNTLCTAVVSCAQKNDCTGTPCYCGAGPVCGLPAGPCVNEIEAAAGSTDVNVIMQKLNDPNSISALASAADTCRVMQCRSMCR